MATKISSRKNIKTDNKTRFLRKNYSNIFKGDLEWEKLNVKNSSTYEWSLTSTYIKKPPFLDQEKNNIDEDLRARPLLILGDSITTDHISPAGVIKERSSAGKYLRDRQIKVDDFNSYGARRGNHESMTRGTFANVRIKNKMVEKLEDILNIFLQKKREKYLILPRNIKKKKFP